MTPVGGRPVPIDVRVIAATHRDLFQAVRDGKFREDLYYRLGVVPVVLPPLRERLADIIPLAEHFLAFDGSPAKRLSADAASRLLAYPWPGNVRELLNATKRAATLVRRPVIAAEDLAFLTVPGIQAGPADAPDWLVGTLPEVVARVEMVLIQRARLRRAVGTAPRPRSGWASGASCSTRSWSAMASQRPPNETDWRPLSGLGVRVEGVSI